MVGKIQETSPSRNTLRKPDKREDKHEATLRFAVKDPHRFRSSKTN